MLYSVYRWGEKLRVTCSELSESQMHCLPTALPDIHSFATQLLCAIVVKTPCLKEVAAYWLRLEIHSSW